MEVTISAGRAGLKQSLVQQIKHLSPRHLVPHNVERQLRLRVEKDPGPLLEVGDLVVHVDSADASPEQIVEVHSVDESRVDLYDPHENQLLKDVPFWADLLLFDAAPRRDDLPDGVDEEAPVA
jgi:hypothetical protein